MKRFLMKLADVADDIFRPVALFMYGIILWLIDRSVKPKMSDTERVLTLIRKERQTQRRKYSKDHDASHGFELVYNAAQLLSTVSDGSFMIVTDEDSDLRDWALSDEYLANRLKQLVSAAALLTAEIELEIDRVVDAKMKSRHPLKDNNGHPNG